MLNAPLTLAELAAALDRIGGFEARPVVAVAVSGGPDSMALMLLADRWARQRGGQALGLTVDHGLRPESAAEARLVAGWLAAHGITHETLVWTGDKPTTGIQEAARDARYTLLVEWCCAHGVLHLLTAHHRDDQIETHLIRRRAGSGPDGLAGMSGVREVAGCRIVRPLLQVSRARLAAFLEAEGQPFLCDPSNLNPAFERARLRLAADVIPGRTLGASPERNSQRPVFMGTGSAAALHPGMTVNNDVTAVTDDFSRQRIERERALYQAMARAVSLHPAGFAALDAARFGALDPELAERLLGRIAACVGSAIYPVRRQRLSNLREGLAARPDRARTLGGCRLVPWRGRILVIRELAAASPPVRLDPDVNLVWDGRFAVDLPATAAGPLMLGCFGQTDMHLPEPVPGGVPPDLPRLVWPVLPAFWDAGGLLAVPHLGFFRVPAQALPCVSFRPAHALAQPGFTVV